MCMGGPVPGWCGRARMPRAYRAWRPLLSDRGGYYLERWEGAGRSMKLEMHACVIGLLASVVVPRDIGAAMAACQPESISVDTSRGDNYASGIVGHSPGESFVARDTLVSSISVWREGDQWNDVWPMKLWIVGTDTSGRPDPSNVVFEGPSITVIGVPT